MIDTKSRSLITNLFIGLLLVIIIVKNFIGIEIDWWITYTIIAAMLVAIEGRDILIDSLIAIILVIPILSMIILRGIEMSLQLFILIVLFSIATICLSKSFIADKLLGQEKTGPILAKILEKIPMYLIGSHSLIYIGVAKYVTRNFDEALTYFNEALKRAKSNKDTKIVATCLYDIGLVYKEKGEFDTSLKYLEDALRVDIDTGNKKCEGYALSSIGSVYIEKGDFDTALKYYEDALRIHRDIGYKDAGAYLLALIGSVYTEKGDFDTALKYYEDALRIHRDIRNRRGEASDLVGIGLVYKKRGDFDTALEYYNDALEIYMELKLMYDKDEIVNAIKELKNLKEKIS